MRINKKSCKKNAYELMNYGGLENYGDEGTATLVCGSVFFFLSGEGFRYLKMK
jgi:hypothetical protein